MRLFYAVSVCMALCLGLTNCADTTLQTSEWKPDFAISLINSEFSLLDVIEELDEQGAFLVDPGQLVHLIYKGRVFSISGEELVQLPDIEVPLPDGVDGFFPNTVSGVGTVSNMLLKGGKLRLEVHSPTSNQVRFTLRLPSFIKGETVLEIDSILQLNAGNVIEIDLNGYRLESTDQGFGFSFQTQEGKDVFGTVALQNMAFSFIQGRFEPVRALTEIDTVDIKLFKSQASGVLHFKDYQMVMAIYNSVGIPISGKASTLNAVTNYQDIMDLESEDLRNGIPFTYPDVLQVGQTMYTDFVLNESNSNLGEVLAAGPREIAYQFEGQTLQMNKDGFIQDTSRFTVEVEVDLPLHLRADHVLLRDTFEFGLRELEEFDVLEDASLRIQTENGFPAELDMQIYFLDPQGAVLDSLYESFRNVFQPAAVDNEGRVTEIQTINYDVSIPQDKLLRIANTDQVAIVFEAVSWNNGETFVKMFDDYTFALRIGLRAKLNQ